MNYSLKTQIGQFRLIAFLEGVSLLLLLFICVPLKYVFNEALGSEIVGPVHGVLFILFVVYTFLVSVKYKWKFFQTTWKVLLACFIPFGTFYIDKTILGKMDTDQVEV
jgi:integral membrane protein